MKKHTTVKCAIALLSVSVFSTSLIAKAEDKEESTTMESIPAAAASAIKKQAAGAKITGVSKEDEDGKTVYEAKIKANGSVREVSVDSNGKVASVEEVIQLSGAPEAVRTAIEADSKGGKVEKIEKVNEGGKTTFEALISAKGKREEVVFSPEGKVVTREDKKHDKDKD